jgi:hypothetical protein
MNTQAHTKRTHTHTRADPALVWPDHAAAWKLPGGTKVVQQGPQYLEGLQP